MAIARVHGRVFPSFVRLTASGAKINYKTPSSGIELALETTFNDDGTVVVACDLIRFDMSKHQPMLHKTAQHLAQPYVDLATLRLGRAVSLILSHIEWPDGSISEIDKRDSKVEGLTTVLQDDNSFKQLVGILFQDHQTAIAVRDLADTLRQEHIVEINFGRVMDAICIYFAPPGAKRDKGWEPMRTALHISGPYLRSITDASIAPRHGDQSGAVTERQTLAVRSWTIMNRFLEYRKRGDQPLSDADFPLLELTQV